MKNWRQSWITYCLAALIPFFPGAVNATLTVSGVTCASAISSTDGSGNVTIVCSASPSAPGVPTLGAVIPGNGQVVVNFTPGSGGAATSYTVTCVNGNNVISNNGTTSPITVLGLTNDSTTSCSVTATNAIGTSSASSSIKVFPSATSPATSPAAPVIGSATPLDSSASISFAAGGDGGSPITGYNSTCSPAGAGTGAASPITVTGMTNGVLHNCTVTATNIVGVSPPSGAVGVTPVAGGTLTVPGAPTIGSATGSGTTISVSFAASTNNGGAQVQYYTAVCDGALPASQTSGASSPLVVTGVTNLGAYSCRVTATNSIGTSAPSASASAQWGSTPGVPSGVAAVVASASSATISFTPGAAGTTATDQYRASCTGGLTATASSSPITVTGLTTGQAYTCTVAAHNTIGWSAESAASNSVTPSLGTAPSAPGTPTATAGDASLSLQFSAPSSSGTLANGSAAAITSYNASCSPSGTASGASSPLSVTGLTNGTAYTCTVTATNSAGLTGAASSSSTAVTPVAGVACAPGETFNPSASPPDKDWTTFNQSFSVNFPSFQAKYATGTAVRFVPNVALNPSGAGLQMLSGYGTGATLMKEVVISACPHSFTPYENNAYCRKTGIQYGYIMMYFRDATHTTPASYDCALDSGSTYYINVRNYSTTGVYSEVSTSFNLDPHF